MTHDPKSSHSSFSSRLAALGLAAALTLTAGLAAVPADAASCITPPATPHAWWKLDTTIGLGTATPELMAQNHAVLFDDPQVIQNGYVGQAFNFDGDDYLVADDCRHIDIGTADFSILVWVNMSGNQGTVLSKRTRTGSQYVGYHLELPSGRPLLQIADPASNWINFYATTLPPVNDGQWHLVAVSVDRDSTTGVEISVDGGTPQIFDPTGRQGNLSNSAPLRIGRAIGNAADNYFTGDLDELQIFKQDLTQAQIQAIYLAGPDGQCTKGLPSHLSCNDNSGN